jgi:hypothetical protein
MDSMRTKKEMGNKRNVKNTFKLPEIFAPARIPVTEGKKTPNTCWNVSPF